MSNIMSRIYVTVDGVLVWMIWFIALIHSTRDYRWYNVIADLHTLQFAVAHALGFSVFTIRILATDFSTVIIVVSLQMQHTWSLLCTAKLFFLPSAISRDSILSQLSMDPRCSIGADPTENTVSILILQEYFDCCLLIRCRGNLFTESLPSNERVLWLSYSGF
jgi:hypothetical protein